MPTVEHNSTMPTVEPSQRLYGRLSVMSANASPFSVDDRIRMTEGAVEVMDAIAIGLTNAHVVLDIIFSASTLDEARAQLMTQFGLKSVQADAVMDIQFRRANATDRLKVQDQVQALNAELASLRILRGQGGRTTA